MQGHVYCNFSPLVGWTTSITSLSSHQNPQLFLRNRENLPPRNVRKSISFQCLLPNLTKLKQIFLQEVICICLLSLLHKTTDIVFYRAHFFIPEQSSSRNSDIVTVCAAHQWNKTLWEYKLISKAISVHLYRENLQLNVLGKEKLRK